MFVTGRILSHNLIIPFKQASALAMQSQGAFLLLCQFVRCMSDFRPKIRTKLFVLHSSLCYTQALADVTLLDIRAQ